MHRPAFAAVLVFALASVGVAEDPKEELKLTKDEQAMIDLTNAERKKADLPPLKVNAELMAAARAHAANMAKQEKPDHVLDGKGPLDRVKTTGYKLMYVGENVGWNYSSPKAVVAGWMDSKLHKENILKKEYVEIGVAVMKSKKGEPYWVQVFGAQRRR